MVSGVVSTAWHLNNPIPLNRKRVPPTGRPGRGLERPNTHTFLGAQLYFTTILVIFGYKDPFQLPIVALDLAWMKLDNGVELLRNEKTRPDQPPSHGENIIPIALEI